MRMRLTYYLCLGWMLLPPLAFGASRDEIWNSWRNLRGKIILNGCESTVSITHLRDVRVITLSGYGPLRIGLISPEVLEASNSEQTVALFRGDKIMKQIKENTAAVFEAMEVENLDEVACRQGSNAALFLVDGNEHIGNCITLKTFKPLGR